MEEYDSITDNMQALNCHTKSISTLPTNASDTIYGNENGNFNLSDSLKSEGTKATISQAFGTAIYPIGKELGRLAENGIESLKLKVRDSRKKKLYEKKKHTLDEIKTRIENDSERLADAERVYTTFEEAAQQDLDDESVLRLWMSLIDKINQGDPDTDLLIEKLKQLPTSEARFIVDFHKKNKSRIPVNPSVTALKFSKPKSKDYLRDKQIAASLSEKNILYQNFPFLKTVLTFLITVASLLMAAEAGRPFFLELGINISSANNVILLGVVGVFTSFIFLSIYNVPTKLTWLGEKLHDGAMEAKSKKDT